MSKREDGSGSIWKEGKRWLGRVKSPATGKPVKVSGRTKAEVTDKLRAITAEPVPTGYTVRTAAADWTALHARTWRASTVAQYEYLLRLYILPTIGDRLPENIRPKDIQSVIAVMSEHGLAAKTMSHARIIMHGLFAWLVDNEHLDRNPVARIRIPETERERPHALSLDDITKLLEAMEHSRWILSVRFALLTGLRRGELLALRWEDVSEDGWVSIRRTRARSGEEGPPKSRAGIRRFKAGKAVTGLLESQREQLRIEGIVSSHVFPSETGAPIQPTTYYRTIKRFARKAGIQLTVHELRHTFVTLAGRGMDIKVLQSILGHASSTQTLDLYQHLMGDALDRASKTVDDAAELIDGHSILPKTILLSPSLSPNAKKRVSEKPETRSVTGRSDTI